MRRSGMLAVFEDMTPLEGHGDTEQAFEEFMAELLSKDDGSVAATLEEKKAFCEQANASEDAHQLQQALPLFASRYVAMQGVEAITVLSQFAGALNSLLQTREAALVVRRMLTLCDSLEPFAQSVDMRTDAMRSYAQSCASTHRFEQALQILQQCKSRLPKSTFLAGTLLHEAEVANQYAIMFEHHQENPRFLELMEEGFRCCEEAREVMDSFNDVFSKDFVFSRPEALRVNLAATLGDMDRLEAENEHYIQRLLASGVEISPLRLARIYEEYGISCLDSGRPLGIVKAEGAFEKALMLYNDVPGLEGMKLELYSRVEHLGRVFLKQKRVEEFDAAMEACMTYIEQNCTLMPLFENDEMRMEVCIGRGAKVACELRLKRRISSKRPRLPVSATIVFEVLTWDKREIKYSWRWCVTEEVLNNKVRAKRVVSVMLPLEHFANRAWIRATCLGQSGAVLSLLEQPFSRCSILPDKTVDEESGVSFVEIIDASK
jgi:tetratricopeptide (TPR) repeat protein